jgi:hypothetical protein
MPWNKATATGGNVSVTVTRDFGRVSIREGQVKARSGESVLDTVKRVAAVKTDYGGGFVSAIEGVGSAAGGGQHSDWFYYVNGILSGVGASQYPVRGGDSVWWDFHEWSKGDFTPAVVGAYPMPFSRGYAGARQKSRLLYGDGMEGLAREAGRFLQANGANIEYTGDVRGAPAGDGPAMAFLSLRQAGEIPWVRGLLDRASNRGAFAALDGGNLVPLNAARSPAPAGERVTAAILCTGSGMGDGSAVWLVICDGAEGTRQAGRLLTSERESLRNKVGLMVDSKGAVLALPR